MVVGRAAAFAAVGAAEAERAWEGGLHLGVGIHGVGLRRSQRDSDFWAKLIFVPVHRDELLGKIEGGAKVVDATVDMIVVLQIPTVFLVGNDQTHERHPIIYPVAQPKDARPAGDRRIDLVVRTAAKILCSLVFATF